MTERLYLSDSYMRECEAKVLKAEGRFIELDRTVFYAQGGGQPCDTGKMATQDGQEYKVVSVKNSAEEVSHEVDHEGLRAGDKVKCVLDWEKRYKHMRMHTSAHIMAAVVHKEYGALITGNQLGEQQTRMDFDAPQFTKEKIPEVEAKANEVIARDLPVSIAFEEREKALARAELFRLKDVLPKDLKVFRILSIGDFDVQADGGTHVKSTKEIGRVKIVDMKNKGAENRRIYWELE
ncbi:MAG: alanyl-tRNA editing protein [Candidatus Diapherotrites archaeon]|uniref:Alanyl-tRNA editing protein n=1 Tax=Candidatus Iainarchaeum sp. TaxID=3101447 RepID=A0A8T3YMG1_9ARCH|nr:alanyl-tRNA editing protein [Candidatus Diapherotrites archaeon]